MGGRAVELVVRGAASRSSGSACKKTNYRFVSEIFVSGQDGWLFALCAKSDNLYRINQFLAPKCDNLYVYNKSIKIGLD